MAIIPISGPAARRRGQVTTIPTNGPYQQNGQMRPVAAAPAAAPPAANMMPAKSRRDELQDRRMTSSANFLASTHAANIGTAETRAQRLAGTAAGAGARASADYSAQNLGFDPMRRGLLTDQNARANSLVGADVAESGSRAKVNTAQATTLIPARAGQLASQGKLLEGQAAESQSRATNLIPQQGAEAAARAGGIYQQSQTEAAMRDPRVQQQNLQNQRMTGLMPLEQGAMQAGIDESRARIPLIGQQGKAQTDLIGSQAEVNRAQAGALQRPVPLPATDGAKIVQDRYDTAKKIAKDRDTFAFGFGVDEDAEREKVFNEMGGTKVGPQPMTAELAQQYIQQAGGDKAKARANARKDGHTF